MTGVPLTSVESFAPGPLAVPLVLLFWTLIQVFWVERKVRLNEDEIAPVVEE